MNKAYKFNFWNSPEITLCPLYHQSVQIREPPCKKKESSKAQMIIVGYLVVGPNFSTSQMSIILLKQNIEL